MSTVAWLAGAAAATQLAPAVLTIGPVRRRVAPRLAGQGRPGHVALTFDDGPDPRSTPRFLTLLERYDVRATFFLLGAHVAESWRLVAEMAERGHEVAVHGWDHRCTAAKRPGALADQVRRAADVVQRASGQHVERYRPPYGVLTAETFHAARRAGLETVLWSAWGRDWEQRATPASVVRTVDRTLTDGGTVLLHDTDRTSAPRSWRVTLSATEVLLQRWADGGQPVGPLREHQPN
ncbi:MAG: polysaccharide deacetylase family protein [Nocardioidaceae bacterium]|nr:polysaccharide deacetylase family protein [Nocardioidaceae bacterium]